MSPHIAFTCEERGFSACVWIYTDYTYSRWRDWGGWNNAYAEYVCKQAKNFAYEALKKIGDLHYKVVDAKPMLYPILEQYKLSNKDCTYGLKIEEWVGYESTEKLENRLHAAISAEAKVKVSRG